MPENEKQQSAIPGPPMPVPLPGGPGEDFFRFRIDGSDILEDMGHQLRGEVYDPTEGKYVGKFDRWVNDDGINKILHIIYSCGINKNIFLGNLTKDEIMFKCKMIKKKVSLLFFKRYHEFNIKKEMRDLLVATIVNTIHSGLSRSEGGKESDQISTAAQRYEVFQHQQQQQQEKRGMGRIMPFWNRKGYN